MSNLNFDPVVGEEVRIHGRPGLFKVVEVHPFVWIAPTGMEHLPVNKMGLDTVDLQGEGGNSSLQGVPWVLLEYIDETRPVRRFLEWLKQDDSFRYPQGITGFRVDSEERYDGEPQFVVRFLVDGAASPTREIVREWNDFTSRVREQILTLNLDRWVQVMVQKEQETMHAAR